MVASSWFSAYQEFMGSVSWKPNQPNETPNSTKRSKFQDVRSVPGCAILDATSRLEPGTSPDVEQASPCNICSSSWTDSPSDCSGNPSFLTPNKVEITRTVESRSSTKSTTDPSCTPGTQVASSRNDWVDVDHLNVNDPQACPAYAPTIFKNMRASELTRRASPRAFEELQVEVTSIMRAILVDWLVDVAEQYKLCADTLFQTINYADRFLSIHPITQDELQAVGAACMWIASKYEEIFPPTVLDFCEITANAYSKEQLIQMEKLILHKLDYQLTVPTPKLFLRRLLQVCNPDEHLHFLSNYFTEISLLELNMHKFLQSEIAAAAVYLANSCLQRKPWDENLRHHSMYSSQHVLNCVRALQRVLKGAGSNPRLVAIFSKYGHSRYCCVSRLPTVVGMMHSFSNRNHRQPPLG